MNDYIPDEGIWREDDDTVYWLKKAMQNLEPADRVIFLLYCELGSLRLVGKVLGVSHSIIYKNIKRIRQEMYDYIKVNCTECDSVFSGRFEWDN
jgi:transposase-like protein